MDEQAGGLLRLHVPFLSGSCLPITWGYQPLVSNNRGWVGSNYWGLKISSAKLR